LPNGIFCTDKSHAWHGNTPEELLLFKNPCFFSTTDRFIADSKVQKTGHQWISLLSSN